MAAAPVVLAGTPAVMPARAAPPQVNLLVEMRAVSVAERAAAPGHGGWIAGTRGGSPAAAGDVRIGTRRPSADDSADDSANDSTNDSTRQVLVLNGGAAALRTGDLQPLSTGDWAWAGSGTGAATRGGVGQARQWIEVGRGFQVKPSWPGGNAPVTLEISAEAAPRTTAQTRLLLAPRTWTEFARSAQTALQVRVSPQP